MPVEACFNQALQDFSEAAEQADWVVGAGRVAGLALLQDRQNDGFAPDLGQLSSGSARVSQLQPLLSPDVVKVDDPFVGDEAEPWRIPSSKLCDGGVKFLSGEGATTGGPSSSAARTCCLEELC